MTTLDLTKTLRALQCLMAAAIFSGFGRLQGQGLMINEISNGPSGNKEYTELVVIGPICGTADIRGWIIDDNNGDFACGPISGVGIAQGHIRFANNATWAAVPVGSIIVIHNDADLNALVPANDPTDANLDSLYVVPLSSTLLERTTGTTTCPLDAGDQIPLGCNAACPAAGSSAYAPSVYAAGGSITPISMANGGDAMQVRDPLGAYGHGLSWGIAAVTGGPDNTKISASGASGRVYYFSSGNYRTIANWTSGVDDGLVGGDETPGLANNAANQLFLDSLGGVGVCSVVPVEYHQPLSATLEEGSVHLRWSTVRETGSKYFEVLRWSKEETSFVRLGTTDAAGYSEHIRSYEFEDKNIQGGTMQYRLRQVDIDGAASYSAVAEISIGFSEGFQDVMVFPNPAMPGGEFTLRFTSELSGILQILDQTGRVITERSVNGTGRTEEKITGLGSGLYFYRISSGGHAATGAVSVQ